MLARLCAAEQTRSMTQPPTQARASTSDLVVRIVGAVLTLFFAMPFLLFAWVALSSRFSWTSGDVHGYGMIFGTLIALVAGLLVMLVAPLVLPSRLRAKGYLISALGYVVVGVGLVAAWFTA